jgi:hypothetical protein
VVTEFAFDRPSAMIQSPLLRWLLPGELSRCPWSSCGPSVITSLSTLPSCLQQLVSFIEVVWLWYWRV